MPRCVVARGEGPRLSGLCFVECPVHAIYTEDEVPGPCKEWTAKNKELFSKVTNFTEKKMLCRGR